MKLRFSNSLTGSKAHAALDDIRDAILLAQSFVEGFDYDRFCADLKTFHAVTRMLEIISEASRRLPPEMRDRYPDLPWREIRDAGNFYRHQYDHVAEIYIWNTVATKLPRLLDVVEAEMGRQPDGA